MKLSNTAGLLLIASSAMACMPPGPVDSAVDAFEPGSQEDWQPVEPVAVQYANVTGQFVTSEIRSLRDDVYVLCEQGSDQHCQAMDLSDGAFRVNDFPASPSKGEEIPPPQPYEIKEPDHGVVVARCSRIRAVDGRLFDLLCWETAQSN